MGPDFLVNTLINYEIGKTKPVDQSSVGVSITNINQRFRSDRLEKTAVEIERSARAYENWPQIWTTFFWNGRCRRIKLVKVCLCDLSIDGEHGTVHIIDSRLFLTTGDGSLELLQIQPEGSRILTVDQFLHGYRSLNGMHFGKCIAK